MVRWGNRGGGGRGGNIVRVPMAPNAHEWTSPPGFRIIEMVPAPSS